VPAVEVPLVDHHCHGVVPHDLDRPAFEGFINEGFAPAPEGTSHFDSPVGLAIRRWCAPVLDLPPLPSPDEYLARRAALGAEEAQRRLLRAAGLEAMLVETGYRASSLLGPEAMGALAAVPAHQVVRLEAVAEAVARGGVDAAAYPDAFARALEEGIANGELRDHDVQVAAAAIVGALGEALVGPLSPTANGRGARRHHDALVANLVQFCLNAIRKESASVGTRSHA
jgi:hypothetical protein